VHDTTFRAPTRLRALCYGPAVFDARYFNRPHRTGRRRFIELQCRLYGLDPLRIEGFGPGEGADEVLPRSNLSPGPKALMATWYLHVRAIGEHGARDGAPWLLLFEDDALLAPRFLRRATAAVEAAPDDCLLVQLGFLSKYTWFAARPQWINVAMAGLFVLRGEWRRDARLRGGGDDPTFSRDLLVGSHATAVRVATIAELLELLEPYEKVTDDLFRLRATQHPDRFLRHRRQLAVQAPFFRSDMRAGRRRINEARRAAERQRTPRQV
jgi:hypothetical protein